MNIDITTFNKINIIDSCAIDNLLSSDTLYRASINAGCKFCYTKFVEYEMFFKECKNPTANYLEIQQRLKKETHLQRFECHNLSIDDLQDIDMMSRKKLGMGELSSIAFAKKIRQSFMTDDQGARKFAETILEKTQVQTTPRLLGWLFYHRHLIDSDFKVITKDHENNNRRINEYFKKTYDESQRIRLPENKPCFEEIAVK